MMYETIILGLLTTAAFARPQHGHALAHKRFHGSGTAAPYPTGGVAPFPAGNSTGPFSNTTGTGVAPPLYSTSTVQSVVTLTVVPVAAATSDAPVEAASSVDANNQAATDSAATCAGTPSTTTVTTTEIVTLTVDEAASSTAVAVAAAASSAAAGEFFAPSYSSSSSVAAVVAEAPAASTSYSTSTVAPTSSEAVAPATTETPSATVEAATLAVAASTSAAASATASTVSTATSGSKRGLAYNDVSLTDIWSAAPVSWAYNWGATSGGTVGAGLEYVPMAWCSGSISVEDWTDAANSAIASGSTHVLGFNEPDQSGQCNIAAADAASGHIEYMNQFSGKAEIGSPAVTNGGGTMGLTYLQSFFESCAGGCKVDFLSIHWYGAMGDTVVDDFKTHITAAIDLANKNSISKIWITEFALDGASDADTASFLSEVLPFLDSQSQVERYAFFMCSDGSLVSGDAISSTIGAVYVAA